MLKLILMSTGPKKDGSEWGKIVVKSTDSNGSSRLAELWAKSADVIKEAQRVGVKEDEKCEVVLGFDDYLHPVVTKILPVPTRTNASGV